jgi:hypothetical protein
MELKDFLAISGKPGLFKYISQAKNGVVVESLTDGKRIPAFASDKVSSLEDIAIFTEGEDVKLSEVFDRIFSKENGGPAMSHKSEPAAMQAYFAEVLPEYDRQRVYASDIRKVLSWYNQLQSLGMLKPSVAEEAGEKEVKETAEEKPAKPVAQKQPKSAEKKPGAKSPKKPEK